MPRSAAAPTKDGMSQGVRDSWVSVGRGPRSSGGGVVAGGGVEGWLNARMMEAIPSEDAPITVETSCQVRSSLGAVASGLGVEDGADETPRTGWA